MLYRFDSQGLRPATNETIESILRQGGSVLLCPGGVQVGAPSHACLRSCSPLPFLML
jgi:hypothetical protein